jgi:hypothetical protein
MNYFKYLFSDKTARLYLGIFYIVIIPMMVSLFITNIEFHGYFIIISLFFIPILFYFYSFVNQKIGEKFLKKYAHRIKKDSLEIKHVEISQESYYLAAVNSNYLARINPKVRKDEFLTAIIDDYLLIIGKSYAFGVFKEDLKPILVSLNQNPIDEEFEHVKLPVNYKIIKNDESLEIIFTPSIYSINKITIESI